MKKLLIYSILLFMSYTFYAQSSSLPVNGPEFSLEKLDVKSYYYGKLSGETYYIKFSKVDAEYAEGSYFVVNKDAVFAKNIDFTIKKKRKKYILTIQEKSYEIKTDFIFRTNIISGTYAVNKKVLKVFNKYKWSDKIKFKKYRSKEFLTYPRRYKDEIFEDVIVKKDIYYGKAKGYWNSYPVETETYLEILEKGVLSSITKKDLDLRMDIYLPKNDTLKKRPLIMFIHGGGFYIGDKQTKAMVEWCKYFASLGYVTASINYRIGFKPFGPSIQRAGYRGLQDAHAAMRFLVSKEDAYGINTNLIFVGGSSAGGVTSMNLAYLRNKNRPNCTKNSFLHDDQGNIESSSNKIKANFKIKAVINMWGAISDLSILKNSKASLISFHGDADNVVPIDHNYPFQDIQGSFSSLILDKMYGSLPIHIEAKRLGIREELHIFEDAGHSPHVDENDKLNEKFYFISEKLRDFLYDEVIEVPCEIQSVPATPVESAMLVYKISCDEYLNIHWKIEGGIITGTKRNSVRVTWFSNSTKHKLVVSGCYKDGAGFYDEYEF